MVIGPTTSSAARRIGGIRHHQEEQDTTKEGGGNCYNGHKLDVISEDGNSTNSAIHSVDDNEVVDKVTCEILSRLPARSLVRFKCVCKSWRFLVARDRYFQDLCLTRPKTCQNFFVLVQKPFDGCFRKVLLLTGDYLSDEGRREATVDITNTWEIEIGKPLPHGLGVFGPLNGLVGFYDPENYSGVRLSNVCTQEITPWMESTSLMKYRPGSEVLWRSGNCQLGFDPVTRKHKVISVYIVTYVDLGRASDVFCEVWTVGDHEWRNIAAADVPSYLLDRFHHIVGSVCSNGSIYYNTFGSMKGRYFHNNDKIVMFDVGSEKFRAITVPNFILDHPRDIGYDAVNPVGLLEVDACLAVFCRIHCWCVKLWLYDDRDQDDEDDHKRENCWRELSIGLPFLWDKDRHLTFLSSAGGDQIIIKSCLYFTGNPRTPRRVQELSYHSYNWRNKTPTRLEINGIPFAIGHLFKTAHWDKFFTESVLSLQ